MNALEFEAIYNYLSSNVYPDDVDKTKKRNLRRRASAFVVREGQLYYSAKDGTKLVVQALTRRGYWLPSCTFQRLACNCSRCTEAVKQRKWENMAPGLRNVKY